MTKFNLAKLRKTLRTPQKHSPSLIKKQTKSFSSLKHRKKQNSFDLLINASMFRFLNEKLYTCSSKEAVNLFKEDPEAFNVYHEGYQLQLSKWPQDPILWVKDEIIKHSSGFVNSCKVADLGCGDARLSRMLSTRYKVYSFDLVSSNEHVIACDMAHTPLETNEVDFAVFCLSLMGTNCSEFLYEANRILKSEGLLLIVDVASRFDGEFNNFLKKLKRYGFSKQFSETTSDTYFVRALLRKVSSCITDSVKGLPKLKLKPCLYKKK